MNTLGSLLRSLYAISSFLFFSFPTLDYSLFVPTGLMDFEVALIGSTDF